jgi:hypothetical protein
MLLVVTLIAGLPVGYSPVSTDARAQPTRVVTVGMEDAACKAQSTDTLLGMMGCEGVKRSDHLKRITLIHRK